MDRRLVLLVLLAVPVSAQPTPYTFYPHAGIRGRDLVHNNTVDLVAGPAIGDYLCGERTFNRHNGHDTDVRSFREQDIGVPVFAALDGTVVAVRDGAPDRNIDFSNRTANLVTLDHGGGHFTKYLHFRKESISVVVGDSVRAGTQLGLTGSSGLSTHPHLHFESIFQSQIFEPFAGPCRPGSSDWVDQPNLQSQFYVGDFYLSQDPIPTDPRGLVEDPAERGATFAQGLSRLDMRADLRNLPAQSRWRVRVLQPDGSTAADFNGAFGNSKTARRHTAVFFAEASFEDVGTWRALLDVNGQTVVDAPFEIVEDASQVTNRPPAAVTVYLDPPAAVVDEVVRCVVASSLVFEDPDYDLVRYLYRWRVNGEVVREVTSAARSDVLAAGQAGPGDVVECRVIPSDGTDKGPAAFASSGHADCSAGPANLCLHQGRFKVYTRWQDFSGDEGVGWALPLSNDTGYFWFFDSSNVELVVKIIDGRGFNGNYWVFYGALSNVEYSLTVVDTLTGMSKVYPNPSGQFASVGDTAAFTGLGTDLMRTGATARTARSKGAGEVCMGDTALCLAQDRFRITVSWTDFAGNTGSGQPVPLTSDTGYFRFFDPDNVDLVLKVLDGRPLNGHFWVFYGSLSNVEYEIEVRDIENGESRIYHNPSGTFASVGDTTAF